MFYKQARKLFYFQIKSPLKNITEVLWVFAYLLIFINMLFVDSYFGNSITEKVTLFSVHFAFRVLNYD